MITLAQNTLLVPSQDSSIQSAIHVKLISNRPICQEKKELLQTRLKETFPELLKISINLNTQEVEMQIKADANEEITNKIISYFKPEYYEAN